jgi:hypothetical protein
VSGRYGKGARPSNPRKLAGAMAASSHPVLRAALAAGAIPAAASLASYEPTRLDQGQTGSCTAHGLAGAVFTAAKGGLLWIPSPDVEYKATRALERAAATRAGGTLPELTDGGAELADAIQAMSFEGAAPMGPPAPDGRHSDVDPATVNDELVVARLEAADTTIVTGEYRISATGKALSDQAAAAIAAGYPVYCGFFVDSAFEDLSPGQVAGAPNQADPTGGGHAVYLSGYATRADGSRTFVLTNSWGESWCDDGRCLVSEAWLAAAWELWVIDVVISTGGIS